jgi:hypothetical protein
MTKQPQDDSYPDGEVSRRRDEALRRALSTPPQPKHGKVKESTRADQSKPVAKRGKKRRSIINVDQ